MANETSTALEHEELTGRIIKCFYDVYNALGYGFLESVYENALALELRQSGLNVSQQAPIKVLFKGQIVGEFRADILVEDKVILELKSVKEFDKVHFSQTRNYLKATGIHVALLMNFGPSPHFERLYLNP